MREAAVATDHRRDPVQGRRAEGRIPERLGVVVGVHVDEPWRHDQVRGVHGPPGRLGDVANLDDAAALHPDVHRAQRASRAIGNHAPDQPEIKH